MAIYRATVDGVERMRFRGDFSQAASPIMLECGEPGSGDYTSTPYQVADARHRPREAAEMLAGWCRNEGGEVIGEDEVIEVEEVA